MGKPKISNGDTVKESIKFITAKVTTKSDFVYFCGDICGKSLDIDKSFNFDTHYPETIYNGYLTLYESDNGSRFYIWSRNPITKKNINGWFLTDNIGNFGTDNKEEYLQVIYPVAEKL